MALPAMRWDGHVRINLSSFDTCISLVNIVIHNMYSFDFLRQSILISTKLPYEYYVNNFQILMSKSFTLEELSIYSQVNNTRGGVFYFFIKHDVAYS